MTAKTLNRRVAEKATDLRRAAIYLRISDDREGRELGVKRQEEDNRRLAARLGCAVVRVYKDNDIGASTKSKKPRPDYKRMIADAKAGMFDVIIAYTSNRLTRKPREHEGQLELAVDYGVEFEHVASPSFDLNTSAGRKIARMLAAQDAGEAEDISERVCREKLQSLQQGKWIGGARGFGYEGAKFDEDGVIRNKRRVGRMLVKHEAVLIRKAVKRIIAGDTLYAICKDWMAKGVHTTRGSRHWNPNNLKRILVNPKHAGLVTHHRVVLEGIKGEWQSIITAAEWRAVCAKLNDEKRTTYRGSRSLKWLGTNLYNCGVCPSRMRSAGVSSGGPNGEKHAAYRCKKGMHLLIRADWVDEAVHRTVKELLTRHGGGLIEEPEGEDLAPLYERLNALQARMDELADLFAEEEITRKEWMRSRTGLVEKIGAIKSQLDSRSKDTVLLGVADALSPAAAYDKLSIERKRAVTDALVTVTIRRPTRKGRLPASMPFDVERLVILPRDTPPADLLAAAVA